jgi:hypothetical protein
MWDGYERRSRRYGYVYVANSNYDNSVNVEVTTLKDIMGEFVGKRVRLTALVTEARKSGHAGDRFCSPNMFPVMPNVGEEIFVGIGEFSTTTDRDSATGAADGIAFGVVPADGRDYFWIDPKVLYRLHDQTVEFYVEETEELDLPLTDVRDLSQGGVESISNGDGSFQMVGKRIGPTVKVLPKITRLGEGCFLMSHDFEAGEKMEIQPNDDDGDLSQATDEMLGL